MTLACEDDNSNLVEVVTVAQVDDEKWVGNSLVQIWKVKFGHKVKFLFRLWAQGLVKILSLSLVETLISYHVFQIGILLNIGLRWRWQQLDPVRYIL